MKAMWINRVGAWVLAAMFAVGAAAQSAEQLEGRVVDAQGAAVGFANVVMLSADSAFVSGGSCDADGRFSLPLNERGKWLKASFVGYESATVPAANGATIVLKEDGQVLREVEVVSMRQLVKVEPDRLSYSMEADPEAKTATLMDMLRKVPLVSVDGDEQVRVQGSTSFKYYKNGHPDPSLSGHPKEVLKSIPASMVKRVEVITEPGAKYDAEGTTAILNIVMQTGVRLSGVNGSVGALANTLGSGALNGYLTGQVGKVTLSSSLYYHLQSKKEGQVRSEGTRTYLSTGTRMDYTSMTHQPARVLGGNVEGSWEIDSLNLLTLSLDAYRYTLDIDGENTGTYYDQDGALTSSLRNTFTWPDYLGYGIDGRVDYEHKTMRPGEILTLSYMLSQTGQNDNQEHAYFDLVNPSFAYTGYSQRLRERYVEHTLQADYVRPLWQWHKLEVGGKYILRLNRSHTTMAYDGDESMDSDNKFHHNTQVAAAYASWLYSRGKLSLRAGLRYEYSRLEAKFPNGDGQDYHQNLNDWVPTASATWKFSDFKSLRLSYSTSISRPGISYLNPAVRASATTTEFGNPDLSSARLSSIGLNYQQVGQKVTFNVHPFFSWADNFIGGLTYTKDDMIYNTYSNNNRSRRFGLSGFVQWMMTKTTTLVVNGEVDYKFLRNPSLDLQNDGWSGYFYANVMQTLPWKVRATAGVMWFGLGRDVENLYSYSGMVKPVVRLSLQRAFLKDDRLTVQLSMNNLLSRNFKYENHTNRGDMRGSSTGYSRNQFVQLSLNYRFGKTQTQVKKTSRTIENSDMVGGIQKQGGAGASGASK